MARKTTTSSPRRNQHRPAAKKHAASTGLLGRALRVAGWILPGIVAIILILRFVPPPTSAFIITCQVERLLDPASGPAVMHEWTPMRRIPRHMALAVVAAEDQNFPNHFGFDVDAIARAVEHNKKSQSVQIGRAHV